MVVLRDRILLNSTASFACTATIIAATSCPTESCKMRLLMCLISVDIVYMLTMPIKATAYLDRVKLPTR